MTEPNYHVKGEAERASIHSVTQLVSTRMKQVIDNQTAADPNGIFHSGAGFLRCCFDTYERILSKVESAQTPLLCPTEFTDNVDVVLYEWDMSSGKIRTSAAKRPARYFSSSAVINESGKQNLPSDPCDEQLQVRVTVSELNHQDNEKLQASRELMKHPPTDQPELHQTLMERTESKREYLKSIWERKMTFDFMSAYFNKDLGSVDSGSNATCVLTEYPDGRITISVYNHKVSEDPTRRGVLTELIDVVDITEVFDKSTFDLVFTSIQTAIRKNEALQVRGKK